MAKLTFKGGVHPFDGKALSKNKEIKELVPSGDIVIPLSQHIGAPATPLVKKGDRVLTGQLIGEASGFISANVHSSVSGTVKSIEVRRLANGGKSDCVIIENDGLYEEAEFEKKNLNDLDADEIRERVKAAGVVGMGGAGFPTNVKLTPKNPEQIEYIIVNGAECEPYLTSDYRRMLEEPEKLREGLLCVLKLFPQAKGFIAIEDNKPEAIRVMKEIVKGIDRIEVKELKTKYPQGGERALVFATTGRKLNSDMLPADVGCIVHNVDTIVSIYNAVIEGRPLIRRIVTVTGEAVNNPQNYYVRIGTSYRQLLEESGGLNCEVAKYISGGPMMGFAMADLEVPVAKGTSSLLVLKEDVVAGLDDSPCIRCGRCADACPGRIIPAKVSAMAVKGNKEAFVKLGGMECCECGCCSFICPAKKPLTQNIKSMRKQILADRKKK
ncbi:MAG: electron transport complex subunit RsxC [Lachnospiraceae bacterium]